MKPGLKRLIGGILLLLLAGLIPFGMIMRSIMLIERVTEERFEIPGSLEFKVDEPGRYYLWHHHDTIYEGVTYNVPTELPGGLQITVTDAQGGALDFITQSTMTSSSSSGTKRSVGYVDLSGPDTLEVTVSAECPPTVFSVSQFPLFEALRSFFLGFAVAALCGLLGMALFIWGLVRLCTGKKTPPPMPMDA